MHLNDIVDVAVLVEHCILVGRVLPLTVDGEFVLWQGSVY